MPTAVAWQPSREMQQKGSQFLHNSFFSLKGVQDRPVSVATEFMESDFEDDEILSDYEDGENSPRVSLHSGQPSFTTVSSYDEAQTPRSSRMPTDYHIAVEQPKQVEGPRGPHLFRISTLSAEFQAEFQNALSLSPLTPKVPRGEGLPQVQRPPQQQVPLPLGITPLPTKKTYSGPFQFTDEELDTRDLYSWSPEKVAQRMLNAGFELKVCERFVENDITGGILITLKFEDLKELGIPSFGVRTNVWTQINAMKNVQPAAEPRPETPIEDEPDRHVRRELRQQDGPGRPLRRRASSRRKKTRMDDVVTPLESVSIVGIEQIVPKPHQCSKGENCSKWKRNQRMIEAFKKDHPFVDMDKGGIIMIAGDPGNPETAKAICPWTAVEDDNQNQGLGQNQGQDQYLRPLSDMVPSVVASSDVMGPGVLPAPTQALQEDTLRTVQTRDPQDNVRQFLDFQHQHITSCSEVPPTPPFELYPTRQQPIEGLRSLPRLSIPSKMRQSTAAAAAVVSASQSTVRQPCWAPESAQTASTVPTSGTSYTHTAMEESPDRTPMEVYRFGTPFSEMDVPVTTVPLGPVARDVSQSVPPDMNYRAGPTRTMSRASARRPSFPVLPSLDENRATAAMTRGQRQRSSPLAAAPTAGSSLPATTRVLQPPPRIKYPWSPERATFETAIAPISSVLGHAAPEASDSSSSSLVSTGSFSTGASGSTMATSVSGNVVVRTRDDVTGDHVTYQGPVKKRKTKMLRHEWHDRFVTLKGTRLAVHKDAKNVDRTLEYVDIDDYAIACSSMAASTSKLNAAFKAMSIRRGGSADPMQSSKAADVAAFSFQLIPQDSRGGVRLRKRESSLPTGSSAGVSGSAALLPTLVPASVAGSVAATVTVSAAAAAATAAAPVSEKPSSPPPPPSDAVNGTGKTHHFAVKSRDERIEWMRELMLAKAMRQKGEGFEVSVNGNMI
ncbi:sam and ph domain containing protein [Grosmannia clavigera kw1407]|uniref:Sam and ph domain containing protein n=1 Tax=Grosmannia clavigera (strain kw1407 / UAMH 11150) TaxID=655863 RepID=F0XD86_GROCL|nr:sam and ph domain containing protein [Grosmannia clavigera kw1407]EFX04130.1 sam and ph domain containing protein [Grosmannia clavigera kw1407]